MLFGVRSDLFSGIGPDWSKGTESYLDCVRHWLSNLAIWPSLANERGEVWWKCLEKFFLDP